MMKKYEGPAYNNGTGQSAKRRFDHPTQGMESGKFKFEPAYSIKQKKSQHSEDIRNTQTKQANEDITDELKQSAPKSGLEHYEIPFLKKQHKTMTPVKNHKDLEESQTRNDENHDITSRSQRSNYEPSYKKQIEQLSEEEQVRRPFKPKELPKPYKKPEAIDRRVDENTRLLAKRLHKSKNSFLLFEN